MVIYMLVSLFCGMLNVKVLLNFGLVFFDFVFVLVFFRGFLLCISIILIWVFKKMIEVFIEYYYFKKSSFYKCNLDSK